MKVQFSASTSITGGSLRFFLYKTNGHILMGQINDTGNLNVLLDDNENYFVTYQIVSHEEGCIYSVTISAPPPASANISLTLHKHQVDFNSIPFNI